MSESEHKIIAFDGLSLSGKSTMVGMTHDRTEAEVVRENTFDPYRPTTSKLNTLLKEMDPYQAVRYAAEEFPEAKQILGNALEYASQFESSPQKQALLTYMFTAGRKVVDDHVRDLVGKSDVILDRWQVTGWAYQVDPDGYKWQDIMKLNEEFGIVFPDVQIILTCPKDQIPLRKAYREKQGVGTAGQMSGGKEDVILSAFDEIHNHLSIKTNVYRFENVGVPTPDLREQIKQAIPTFQSIKRILIENGFSLKVDEVKDLESYWLDPERLKKIHERQTR